MGEYEAIFKRKSVRKYQEEPITVAELEEVYELISRHPKLYNIDMELHLVEDGSQFLDLLKGVIGSYGKIIAPHYLIATSEIKEGYLENVGYALEYIVLKMTEMGLGTCYIGGLYEKKNVKKIIKMKDSHQPVIVVAFGYPKDATDYIKLIIGSKRRMELEKFCFGDFDNTWRFIMDAVRLSPSAMNSQPWRFYKNQNVIDMYIKSSKNIFHMIEMNRIDAGIALQHLNIAARYFDINLNFKRLANKEKEGCIYITSIIEKE